MRVLSILTLLFLVSATSHAQQLDMSLFKDIQPRNIGPAGMSGRVTAIEVVESNPDIIFLGTASGGLWKSENGGTSFKPIFENERAASVGAVAINQSNPAEIWIGTGEGNPRNSLNSGNGIYKSIDGGKTWTHMGLEATRNIHRVIIHRDNPNIVYVGAIGSPWGEQQDRGVYKTTDGGKTWRKTLFVDAKSGIGDMVVDPSNPNKIIAAMW
ncbi:MAG: xyloglucanase precursor, partial [Cyclobacteriaceae bacterium]